MNTGIFDIIIGRSLDEAPTRLRIKALKVFSIKLISEKLAKLSNTWHNKKRGASQVFTQTVPVVPSDPLAQRIKLSSFGIAGDVVVPLTRIPFGNPAVKLAQFLGRQLFDGLFDFNQSAHPQSLPQ